MRQGFYDEKSVQEPVCTPKKAPTARRKLGPNKGPALFNNPDVLPASKTTPWCSNTHVARVTRSNVQFGMSHAWSIKRASMTTPRLGLVWSTTLHTYSHTFAAYCFAAHCQDGQFHGIAWHLHGWRMELVPAPRCRWERSYRFGRVCEWMYEFARTGQEFTGGAPAQWCAQVIKLEIGIVVW